MIFFGIKVTYAGECSLQGNIIDSTTKKNVSFAIIIIQEAGLVANAPQGKYFVMLPEAGKYTVKIQSPGLQVITTSVTVEGNVTRDFQLLPFTSRGSGVVIKGERDIQKVSRHTMTVKEIKEVPASFGDSINALTSLPGVNRTDSFFGPLVIRGADSATNGYYIDDIPLFKPMHFGGLHSVINNDLMSEIDLYSSAYPSEFSNAQSAVINIKTVDEVNEFGGNSDVGLLSANVLVKKPITRSVITDGKETKENAGYIIAAGRYGYLSLFIPFIYEHLMNESLDWLPEYWDYQFKMKYSFNSHNSITFLAFGNRDYIDLLLKDDYLDDGDDPALSNMTIYQNDQAHSQGLYYTYKYSEELTNTVIIYTAFNRSDQWYNLPSSTASWARDLGITANPYIFGLKDRVKAEWWKSHGEFRGGVEATYYLFKTSGKTIAATTDTIDLNDENSFVIIPLGQTIKNQTLTWYAENKFTFGGLNFAPGIHSEYLKRTGCTIFDPRGTFIYRFDTDTTIGVAGGYYSNFMQTNATYFTTLPNIAEADYLKPQRSIHRSGSIEQKISSYTFKVEGFYNNFTDIVASDEYTGSDGTMFYYKNEAELKSWGIELLAKVNDESEQGLFGWGSYAFNRSSLKTNQSDSYSLWGDYWTNSPYDMTHIIKIVAGYTFGRNTISGKFQYNTAAPYTAIVGSTEDTVYESANPGVSRHVPEYGKPFTERLCDEYRLDLRYSFRTNYKWGYLSWYVELIGIVSSDGEEYKWDYRYPYSGNNPEVRKREGELSFIPNLGVEVKF